MVLQGTKPSFDLEILLDVSANDTNRDRKSYPYIYRNECKSRFGISFALPHSEFERCLLYVIGGSIPSWGALKKEMQNAIHQDFMIQLQTSP